LDLGLTQSAAGDLASKTSQTKGRNGVAAFRFFSTIR
jgi:hypothetical protein